VLRITENTRAPNPNKIQNCHPEVTVGSTISSPCSSTRQKIIIHVEVIEERRGEETGLEDKRIELPQGTLDLLILKTLALEPQHGWGISERLQQISKAALQVQQGSLYPALHRLERRGWIKAKWGSSENNRRAKYYQLSRAGRKQLQIEESVWRKLTTAVDRVLETA